MHRFVNGILPPQTPVIVDVPPMNYVAVRGKGNPNDEDSEYKASIELLYGIAMISCNDGFRPVSFYLEVID